VTSTVADDAAALAVSVFRNALADIGLDPPPLVEARRRADGTCRGELGWQVGGSIKRRSDTRAYRAAVLARAAVSPGDYVVCMSCWIDSDSRASRAAGCWTVQAIEALLLLDCGRPRQDADD
jgi:hypothetical protein